MKSSIFFIATIILLLTVFIAIVQYIRFRSLRRRGRPASPDSIVILGALAAASAYVVYISRF